MNDAGWKIYQFFYAYNEDALFFFLQMLSNMLCNCCLHSVIVSFYDIVKFPI